MGRLLVKWWSYYFHSFGYMATDSFLRYMAEIRKHCCCSTFLSKKITRFNNWCRITHPKLNMEPQNQRLWKKRFRTLKPGSMLVFGGVFHDIMTQLLTKPDDFINKKIHHGKPIFSLYTFFLTLARKRLLDKSHDPSVMHLGPFFMEKILQVWIPLEIRAKVDELLIRVGKSCSNT